MNGIILNPVSALASHAVADRVRFGGREEWFNSSEFYSEMMSPEFYSGVLYQLLNSEEVVPKSYF
jgi:hypothetical protein